MLYRQTKLQNKKSIMITLYIIENMFGFVFFANRYWLRLKTDFPPPTPGTSCGGTHIKGSALHNYTTHSHTHTRTHAHTYTNIHTYTHTHAHTHIIYDIICTLYTGAVCRVVTAAPLLQPPLLTAATTRDALAGSPRNNCVGPL